MHLFSDHQSSPLARGGEGSLHSRGWQVNLCLQPNYTLTWH